MENIIKVNFKMDINMVMDNTNGLQEMYILENLSMTRERV